MMKIRRYISGLLIIAAFFSCSQNKGAPNHKNELSEPNAADSASNSLISIRYIVDSLTDSAAFRHYDEKYSVEQKEIIAALNRLTPSRIKTGKIIILPDTVYSDIMPYSPFPWHLDDCDSISKLILICKRIQAFGAYENGRLVRWGPTSTGRKKAITPSGIFHTNYKAKLKISTVNGSWRMPWYFNISNRGGIGLHQYDLPGYPASHSCIRLFQKDAFWIFNWADAWLLNADETLIVKKGTPVIIFGTYDYESAPPWKALVDNKDILYLTGEELKILQEYISKINTGN